MKQFIIACSLFSIAAQTLYAQDSILLRRYFRINLTLINGSARKGYLGVLSDSSLGISSSPVTMQVANSSKYPYQKIDYSDMQEMKVRRKSSVGRGVFYGSMIGLVTGFMAGVVQGSDPDKTVLIS